jgi:transcription initiation factor IIE alpha subunit
LLYVAEIVELMAAFPGRDFRIGDVINYVRNGRDLSDKQARAMREGVSRALQALAETGSVAVVRPFTNQRGWAYYHWQMTHAHEPKTTQTLQDMTH